MFAGLDTPTAAAGCRVPDDRVHRRYNSTRVFFVISNVYTILYCLPAEYNILHIVGGNRTLFCFLSADTEYYNNVLYSFRVLQ